MDKAGKTILGCMLLIGLAFGTNAWACSTDAWLGGVAGVPSNATAGSPPDGVARYSGLCALKVVETSHVQSNYAMASNSRYRARFYVLDGLTGSGAVDIFEAYADEGAASPLFKVSFDGNEFTFDATESGGSLATAAAKSGPKPEYWNVVEIDWNPDSMLFSYWVNADATVDAETGIVDAGVGTVEAVRLGAPNGFAPQTGALTFDAFESHLSGPVGTLLACDADGELNAQNEFDVDINDVLAVVDEVFGSPSILAGGQPDCDSDGDVNINDALAIVDIVF